MVDDERIAATPGARKREDARPGRGRLRLRREECVACAACPSVCHTLALRMDALQLAVDENLCDNCGACISLCPVGALYFE